MTSLNMELPVFAIDENVKGGDLGQGYGGNHYLMSRLDDPDKREVYRLGNDQDYFIQKLEVFREAYLNSNDQSHSSGEVETWKKLAAQAKCCWVNMDNTDTHFHSHVEYTRKEDGTEMQVENHPLIQALKLPSKVILLRERCKRRFKWYKKRECERRRRYRLVRKSYEEKRKAFLSKKDEVTVEDLDVMKTYALAILERCEFCGGFFLFVNLFWGATLCDRCYFNPANICSIMQKDEGKLNSFVSAKSSRIQPMEPSPLISVGIEVTPPTSTSAASISTVISTINQETLPSLPPISFSEAELKQRNESDSQGERLFACFAKKVEELHEYPSIYHNENTSSSFIMPSGLSQLFDPTVEDNEFTQTNTRSVLGQSGFEVSSCEFSFEDETSALV